jgi:tetratricopeptide (TPR) repeat protein
MKSKVVDARRIGIGCILLSNALSGAAVTLGRHSGAAIIGRPLDIRVQANLAPGDDLATQCIGADVFFGDAQVPAGLVRSQPIGSGTGADTQIRIQSMQPINEPIVTVDVRAGCNAPFTRRYVLLADPLSEPLPPQRVAPLPVIPSGVDSRPVPFADAGGSSPAQVPVAPPGQAPRSVVQRTVPREPAPVVPRAAVAREPALAARGPASRLQLDPLVLDLQVERDPVLKLSMDLLSEPTSEEARAAAGLMWRALSASPDERWRDVQRLAALEAEAQALRGQGAQASTTIAELNGRLASAESGRYLNGVVYALGFALLLALLALALLWRRLVSGRGGESGLAWWAADDASMTSLRKHDDATEMAPLDLDLTLAADSSMGDFPPLSGSLGALDSLPPSDKRLPSLSGRDRRDFAPSLPGMARSMATEELFDVQQQAEFFMSLGNDDQAVKVLRNHLADSPEPSALAYLDLLMLYHRLGRRDDYEQARAEFNQVFNAGAPPFDQYSDESRGLEDYEAAFGRIQALWPDPRVLDVIEESIFRDPGNAETAVFDLEAYRELLLLHAMAKDMIKREVGTSKPALDFQHTNVEPLKAAAKKVAVRAAAGAASATGVAATGVGAAVGAEVAGAVVSLAGAAVGGDALEEVAPRVQDIAPVDLDVEEADGASPPGSEPVALDVDLSDLSTFSMFEALVLLHSMAKDMIKHEELTSEMADEAQHAEVPPLNMEEVDAAAEPMGAPSLDGDPLADSSAGDGVLAVAKTDPDGLDLDLSETSDFSLFETALPQLPGNVEPAAPALSNQAHPASQPGNLIEFEMPDFLMPEDPWSSERGRRPPGA